MTENEKLIFRILEDLTILFQKHLPPKILKSEEFTNIKEKLILLSEKF